MLDGCFVFVQNTILRLSGREYYMKMSSDNVFSAVAAWHLYRDAPSKKWLLDNDNVPANGYWAYTSYTAVARLASQHVF